MEDETSTPAPSLRQSLESFHRSGISDRINQTRPKKMARDIRVPVLLTAEEYMALTHMADEDGDTQSGFLRRLMRQEARRRASSMADAESGASDGKAHVVHMGG